jgi:hypothetical protein
MISRRERDNWGTPLPEKWIVEASELLQQTFELQLERNHLELRLFGYTYADELCLALGIFSKDQHKKDLWTTFQLSADLEQQNKVEKILDTLLDAFGPLLDQFFEVDEQDSESVFVLNWEEDTFKETKLYYKVTHDNIELSREADKWLND